MSEGKKVLVVYEDLDRVILQEQFIAMGIDVEIVVDRDKAGSIATGLMALPTMRDEMIRVLGQRVYGSDFRRDSGALADRVAKEFNDFCLHYNFKALRDSVIGKINYSLAQGPDSGGNPAFQDSHQEASVSIKASDEIVPTLLTEMLKELKGIKQVIAHPFAEVDLGAPPETSTYGLKEWLEFIYHNPDLVKDHLKQPTLSNYECRQVTSKEMAIAELTNILKLESGGLNLLPSALLFSLPVKDREEIIRLLHPKVSFVVGSGSDRPEPAGPEAIIETLLKALREEVPSDVHFYGLSALRPQERQTLIDKLELGSDKYITIVPAGSKQTLLEGLAKALQEDRRFGSRIILNGIGIMDKEEVTALVNLFKVGLQDTTEFVDGQSSDEDVLDKLAEIFGGDDCNTIVLHNLKGISGQDKRYIYTSLLTAVKKYQELKRTKKEFLVHGPSASKGDNKPANITFTLGELGVKWAREAAGYGIAIEPMVLISHLFGQMGVHGGNDSPAKIFRSEPTEVTVTNVAGATIKMGKQTFSRNEDGSLKIVTQLPNNTVSFIVLDTNGGVMLHGPGYTG